MPPISVSNKATSAPFLSKAWARASSKAWAKPWPAPLLSTWGILWTAVITVVSSPFPAAQACSVFFVRDPLPIMGKSYDWSHGSGLLIINPRNLQKTALLHSQSQPLQWSSRWGSVTFNQIGVDFPVGGMNEAGLTLELLSLNLTEYEPQDSRPALNELQWVQYNLDRFAKVDELLTHLPEVRIERALEDAHFMACDPFGGCAVIQFLKGRPRVYTGADLPIPVLTNSRYEVALRYVRAFKGFGGELPLPPPAPHKSRGPRQRFLSVAARMNLLQETFELNPLQAGMAVVNDVAMKSETRRTQWRVAYSLAERQLGFRTSGRTELGEEVIQVVNLNEMDFSAPIRQGTALEEIGFLRPLYSSDHEQLIRLNLEGRSRTEVGELETWLTLPPGLL